MADEKIEKGDDEEDDEDVEDEEDVEENEDLDLSEGDGDVDMMDEMISDEEEKEEEEGVSDEEDSESENEVKPPAPEAEDIYGRKINKTTGELIKFDPAAARRKLDELDAMTSDGSSTEQRARVDRAVNSIINKLSDAMLVKSQQAIAELWANSSKNDVKSALHKFLSKALLAPFRLQDSLLTTYGAFIAMCHSMISSEISAHFVEVFLCDLVKSVDDEEEPDDKSMENRLVFTAMLVVFRIIQPLILVELIEKFAQNLNLTNLFGIRTIVAYAYKSLKRTSWPAITEKIDTIAVEFQQKPISALPRAKFLLEEVIALKKAPPAAIDYTIFERQQKILQGLTKKKGGSSDSKELSMTLNDLLHAEERGRWWIVGSAFRLPEQGGNGLLASSSAHQKQNSATTFPPEVVTLATKAGMNSEVRRQIFCSVATAEDEDDAFERLLKLSLKGEKERELVHVLIAMMMKEKTFNAFYAELLQRFCEFNKRFVITLQFALWDQLRDCDGLKPFQRSSLAQLFQHLIANEVMPITVLKTVEWATRSTLLTNILKKLFIGLAKSPESVLRRVFEPVINAQKRAKFELLSEGMRVFWHMNLKDVPTYQKIDKWIMESGLD
uniref:MI domain-containing protein n=1 Tax=Caenorhabditis japonica TaxID=281687 RepID=A0A8R1E790_CAEJA